MVKTDGRPTIAWADPGDENDHGHTVKLSDSELTLLAEALDSHAYWQLSDHVYRDSGYVRDPGSDDAEVIEEISRTRELEDRLRAVVAH